MYVHHMTEVTEQYQKVCYKALQVQVHFHPTKHCKWYGLNAYIHFTSFSKVFSEVLLINVNVLSFQLQWIEMPFGVHNSYTTAVRGECHAADSTLLCYTAGHKQYIHTYSTLCIHCAHNQLASLTSTFDCLLGIIRN